MASERLRTIVFANEPDALLGNEEAVLKLVGYSRATLRQAARVLEREGLLRVRRGLNGGYFGTRPSEETIGNLVASYLEMLDISTEDVTSVASALWIDVLRKAAARRCPETHEITDRLISKVQAVRDDTGFTDIRVLEQDSRKAIFKIADCRYIELIFNINTAFASRRFQRRPNLDDTAEHKAFVAAWRRAKGMELSTVANGDVELSGLVARHIRAIWHQRVWQEDWAST